MLNNHLIIESCSNDISSRRVTTDKFDKYAFVCVGPTVRIYDIQTSKIVTCLSHDSSVISIHCNPQNFLQAITCTCNGELALWNYEEATRLKTWNLNTTVKIHILSEKPNSLGFVVVASKNESYQLCEIETEKDGIKLTLLLDDIPATSYKKVCCSPKGDYIAFIDKQNLSIYDVKEKNVVKVHHLEGEKTFHCIRFHPNEDCVATGDSLGRVTLWYIYTGKSIKSYYHWHSDNAIEDIAFPSEGSTMYSGGLECVLVKWTLQSTQKTESKCFLPRLGSKIINLSLSYDNRFIFITLEDNTIQIVSNMLTPVNHISGMSINRYSKKSIDSEFTSSVDMVFDSFGILPKSISKNCLITNGRPGYLQFYDPVLDRQIFNMDVVGRNLPPQEAKTFTDVIQIDFIDRWMASVEYRHDPVYTGDLALKFWRIDTITERVELQQTVEDPCLKVVTDLKFRPMPGKRMAILEDLEKPISLVVTSIDCKADLWELVDVKIPFSDKTKPMWITTRSLTYRNYPAYCCKFNPNGKVLAIGFGNSITLWHFDAEKLLLSLWAAEESDYIKKIEFGRGKQSKLVAILTKNRIFSVWDIDEQIPLWEHDEIYCFSFDSTRNLLALAGNSYIYLNHMTSQKSIATIPLPENCSESQKNDISDRKIRIDSMTFAQDDRVVTVDQNPIDNNNISAELPILYLRTKEREILRICTQKQSDRLNEILSNVATEPIAPKTELAKLLISAKENVAKENELEIVDARYLNKKANLQMLNAPSNTLPDIEMLGLVFLESCLQPKVPESDLHENNEPTNSATSLEKMGEKLVIDRSMEEKHRKQMLTRLKKCDFSFLIDYFSNC